MPSLPPVTQTFVADGRGYSSELRRMGGDADRFSRGNDQAALAARRMGLAAKEAADKAARAQKDAADAAEKLARGELKADEAAKAAARAENELERASLKAAAAQKAAGRAADEAAANFKQLARDAALAAAAEQLGSLKASGSVKEHNAAVLKLRREMPELGKDGSKAFTLMGSASRSFGSALDGATSSMSDLSGIGRAVPSLIAVGLQALPFLATAAGGAISLGLGGALAALAIKAQSSNAQVQKSFSDLRAHVGSELKQISAPFHSTFLTISKDARLAFDSMSPSLASAFAKMAPAISGFSGEFRSSLKELNPAIDSIGTAFSRELNTLGPQMTPIMHNLSTGVQAVTDAVAKNPQALADMANGLSMVARISGDTIGVLTRFEHQINAVSTSATAFAFGPIGWLALGAYKLKNAIDKSNDGFAVAEQTFPSFAQKAVMAAVGAHQLMTAQQAAALTSDQLKNALNSLTSATQGAFDAETQYRQSLVAANSQAKNNNAGIDGSSKAAIANRQALSSLAGAIKNVETSGHHSAAQIENMRQKFIRAAEGMHVSHAAAVALANQLLGIKAPPPIKLSLNDADFMAKLHNAQGLHIDPKTGRLLGNGSDYYNKWLTAKGLKIDPKTGRLLGNNADYYNKWLTANHLRIDPKTGRILGNTSAFWNAVNSIPPTVGYRKIGVYYVPLNSANQPGTTRASGGPIGYAHGGNVARMASGGGPSGQVMGPGTGTSDSIPAMLSNGEYVINAEQTAKYKPLLDAINYKLDGFASGGAVGLTPKQLLARMASTKKKEETYDKEEAHWKQRYEQYRKQYAAHHTARSLTAERHALAQEKKYHKLGAEQDALYKKYKAQYDAIGRSDQTPESRLPAKVRNRPEYQAAMAAQGSLEAMRASMYGGITRGGPSAPGSAHGTVVQHVTHIDVHVAGSVRADTDLAHTIAGVIMTNRIPVALPAGR